MATKVLVFGAGGFLGGHILAQLLAEDFEPSAVVRPAATVAFDRSRIPVLEGDLLDQDLIREAARGMDAIIFAAGRTWTPALPPAEYRRQNVGIARSFFQALKSRPDLRVVFTSSMSTIGGSDAAFVFTEDTDRSRVNERRLSPYDRAKIEAETEALEHARHGGNVVILNPGFMLGPPAAQRASSSTDFLVQWFCQRQVPFYVNGGHSFCDVRDVARAHVRALTSGRSGERFIVAGQNLDLRALYGTLAGLTGVRPPRRVPAWLASLNAKLMDGLSWLTFRRFSNPLHRSVARSLCLYYHGSSHKAIRELGYSPTPLATTLLDTVLHLLDRGLIRPDLQLLRGAQPDQIPALLCLRQLAFSQPDSRFFLARIPVLHQICTENLALRDALDNLLARSHFDNATGRFQFERSTCRRELRALTRLFEYVYFASDKFLEKAIN